MTMNNRQSVAPRQRDIVFPRRNMAHENCFIVCHYTGRHRSRASTIIFGSVLHRRAAYRGRRGRIPFDNYCCSNIGKTERKPKRSNSSERIFERCRKKDFIRKRSNRGRTGGNSRPGKINVTGPRLSSIQARCTMYAYIRMFSIEA